MGSVCVCVWMGVVVEVRNMYVWEVGSVCGGGGDRMCVCVRERERAIKKDSEVCVCWDGGSL
jgi:hypothetical protein